VCSAVVRFDRAFGERAADMVNKMRPGVELFSTVNPATSALLGLPDFVFVRYVDGGVVEVLVGEGKVCEMAAC